MNVVTADSSPDGTAASRSQVPRSRQTGSPPPRWDSGPALPTLAAGAGCWRIVAIAQAATAIANAAKATAQTPRWADNPRRGSIRNG